MLTPGTALAFPLALLIPGVSDCTAPAGVACSIKGHHLVKYKYPGLEFYPKEDSREAAFTAKTKKRSCILTTSLLSG
jgi:hypothetical protein